MLLRSYSFFLSTVFFLLGVFSINLVVAEIINAEVTASAKAVEKKSQSVRSPQIQIQDLRVASIDLSALHLALKLSVANDSAHDLTVEAVNYEVHSMSTVLRGKIHQLEEFKAKQRRVVNVPVSLPHSSSSLVVLEVLKSESRVIPYKIIGKIKIKGLEQMIPFEHLGEYAL